MLCRKRCYRNLMSGDITIEELKRKVRQGAVLIDVRSNQEYREGHIQGAINIPDYEIDKRVQFEVPKRNQLIVLYCQYGSRSRDVYIKMKKMNYTNIYNLYGGLEMM